ncbi:MULTISPECIES: hypothetical protein [Stenotrophomonas]|uniref:hypothetical protein n=1 Tax=Stenotrophomonas TaxID=40323 RepID=UPI0018D44C78|nr:hypothetical protein [Stenotrophomonas sp.]MBH1509742.1 hypothetical protein [Stenotrophomonas maltophilia]
MRHLSLVIAALLAGCATSPKGLERPEYASAFTVDQGYQLTLKQIVAAIEECRPVQLLPVGQLINDVQNYSDLKEARIVQGASGVGTQIYKVIVLKEVEQATTVTLYTRMRAGEELEKLKKWAMGSTDCR